METYDPKIEKILTHCRNLNDNPNSETSFWIVDDSVGRFLNSLAKDINAKKILEIGTSIGYSTIFLAEAVSHKEDGVVFTIESNKERSDLARHHIKQAGLEDNVHMLITHAPENIPLKDPRTASPLTNELDMVFLDCIKKYYLECFTITKPLVKSGGYIVADNILSHPDALSDFVEAIKNDPDFEVEINDMGTGLLLAKKP